MPMTKKELRKELMEKHKMEKVLCVNNAYLLKRMMLEHCSRQLKSMVSLITDMKLK